MYFVNMIGDKYQGKSHKLVTILMPKIECQACFLSPEPLKSASLLGNETALLYKGGLRGVRM